MKLPPRSNRRGQPLTALGVLLIGWIGVRTVLWAAAPPVLVAPLTLQQPTPVRPAGDAGHVESSNEAKLPSAPAGARPDHHGPDRVVEPPPPLISVPLDPGVKPVVDVDAPVPPRIAAGHLMLRMAAVSELPVADNAAVAAMAPGDTAPAVPYLPGAQAEARRWSADGWLLWREGGNGFNLPGAGLPGASFSSGAYGSSQAGLVLRYRLAPESPIRPTLYVRVSSALYKPRGEELAAGLALRPLPKLPLAIIGEGRVTRTPSRDIVRPALAVVSELPPARLPLGIRGEVYAQAGLVGGKSATAFVDGQARAEKPVWRAGSAELRLGGGAWGGAQNGAKRLDVGPSATFDLPVGGVNTRLSADYRFRVAGAAAPGSGVAVTFSAGF